MAYLRILPNAPIEGLVIGCGDNIEHKRCNGYINLDVFYFPGSQVQADAYYLPFRENSFSEVIMEHVYEHFENPLEIMEEVYRVCKPDAEVMISCPYYRHKDAFGDPGHKLFINEQSFGFLHEPNYKIISKMTKYPHNFHYEIIEQMLIPDETIPIHLAEELKDMRWGIIKEIQVILRVIK